MLEMRQKVKILPCPPCLDLTDCPKGQVFRESMVGKQVTLVYGPLPLDEQLMQYYSCDGPFFVVAKEESINPHDQKTSVHKSFSAAH